MTRRLKAEGLGLRGDTAATPTPAPAAEALRVLVGDCRETLRSLEDGAVRCCVTSPPYWGLRDYGTEALVWPAMEFVPMAGLPPVQVAEERCALGMERTPLAFVGHIVAVFREVWRVLAADGSLWLNFGDSYASNAGDYNADGSMGVSHNLRISKKTMSAVLKNRSRLPAPGLKAKDLVGIPWRVALALQAEGWWLRSDIIWHKPNPMPESVSDRPTKAHEYLFLLTKGERYFYDAEAITEPVSLSTHARLAQDVEAQIGSARANGGAKTNGNMKAVGRGSWKGSQFHTGKTEEHQLGRAQKERKFDPGAGNKNNPSFDAALAVMPEMRNKRSVWTVATQAYKGAHFATFPPKLVRPCVLAGSQPGDVVLDPFGGSFTTAQVALECGRRAVMCEQKPEYVRLGMARCETTLGLGI